MAESSARLSTLSGENRNAPRVERFRRRFVLRPGEDVYLVAEPHILEAAVVQHPPPLCLQQSAGDSAGPQLDVVLRGLGHFFVNKDVGDLETAPGLQDAVHLSHYRDLVRAQVDHTVADDHVRGLRLDR